ncbi:MAG: nucleotide exchange factor GrpE [Actinobacteria bacterium]|nr:nucleotide exchange factor GrpE [Actinomycetota bacterium]
MRGRAGGDRLADLEREVRGLIRDLATARADLADRETEDARRTEKLLLSLVEVADAFERVFDYLGEREDELPDPAKGWVANFRTVHRMLSNVLTGQGVTPIQTPSRRFDPRVHQAIETVADDALPEGTVVRELARGYAWGDRVLRKTQAVVVGRGPARTGGPGDEGASEGPWGD